MSLRERLLEAAGKLLEDHGDRLSLREVARQAGVSSGAPYHHFASREALLEALAAEGFQTLREALDAHHDERDRARQLRAMVAAYVLHCAAHPIRYRLMTRLQNRAGESPDGAGLRAERDATYARLWLVVRRIDTTATPEELRRRTVVIWSLCHGAVEALHSGLTAQFAESMRPEDLAERTARAALSVAWGIS